MSELRELSVRLIVFSYISGLLVFLPFVTGTGSITIPTVSNIYAITLYPNNFRTFYRKHLTNKHEFILKNFIISVTKSHFSRYIDRTADKSGSMVYHRVKREEVRSCESGEDLQ